MQRKVSMPATLPTRGWAVHSPLALERDWAITAGWRVGTANVRHFERIPGLDVLVITWRRA